jgi:cbb3-type cytochrome oxidase maturation protein
MDILFLLIPLALAFACAAVSAFLVAVRSGQFDDLETPAHRILVDAPASPSQDPN